jgi:UDP-N-acetylglucosamine 4-epimerase
MKNLLKNKVILVTGGAGFIGSNLCEFFLDNNNIVRCLDNLSTGKKENIEHLLSHSNFTFIEGDIRNLDTCRKAVDNVEYVFHQAALGSVPRSINDPITTNDVNINGFLNMLVAARDAEVTRFIFAASSSTYGDSKELPKIEEKIGKPLSPYAITKYVNELYAEVFHKTYGMETIGLRYFNVYGRKQDPNGAYAAVIPKFIQMFINLESPTINGDGSNSRDFTYIENVIQMNYLAATTNNKKAIGTIFNTAVGDRTNLLQLTELIKKYLSEYNENIKTVPIHIGPERKGDIPHSHASIEKAKEILKYNPSHNLENGLKESIEWYWKYFNKK